MGINIQIFEKMIKAADEDKRKTIIFNINRLLEYSDFVSKLEETIKQCSDSTFMIKKLDEDRRQKHDMAIACIIDLNGISNSLQLGNFYDGEISDNNRDVIARAIYDFSKYYLKK